MRWLIFNDPLHPVIAVSRAGYDYSSDIRRFDTGPNIAASRRIFKGLNVRAMLSWGLVPTLSASTRRIDMDTYNVYLNVGFTYRF